MKIIHFEYYIAVVEHHSFTKAADYLHIAQPSLTQAIKKLERELGYDLLTRSTKDIKITEKGILFYRYAKDIVKNYHLTVEKMYDLNESDEPKIKIGILESTNQWVAKVIQSHANEFPNQRYQVKEILALNDTTNALLNYEVDIALSNDLIQHPLIDSWPLYNEAYVLLSQPDKIKEDIVSIEHLPLILPNATFQVRQHLDEYFSRHAMRPNIVMEVDRFESAAHFVHSGLGYAIIPKIYEQSLNTNQLVTHKIEPSISRTIYMNMYKKRKHSERVLSLINQFKAYWYFDM